MATTKRRGSASAAHRQNTWFMRWMVALNNCAICGGSLAEGWNPRYPGKSITLHHTLGNREEDRWDDPEYVAHMIPCHSSCHRSYHLRRRHAEAGKNVDMTELAVMEQNIRLAVERQSQRKAAP